MGQHWIDPPKRERKRVHNYSEAEYFKNALKSNKGERTAGPRLPKMPQLQVGRAGDVAACCCAADGGSTSKCWYAVSGDVASEAGTCSAHMCVSCLSCNSLIPLGPLRSIHSPPLLPPPSPALLHSCSPRPRPPPPSPPQDFQFYDIERLTVLFEKEHAAEVFKHQQAQAAKAAAAEAGEGAEPPPAPEPSPDDPQPLTREGRAAVTAAVS
jgi:hypothetical protein